MSDVGNPESILSPSALGLRRVSSEDPMDTSESGPTTNDPTTPSSTQQPAPSTSTDHTESNADDADASAMSPQASSISLTGSDSALNTSQSQSAADLAANNDDDTRMAKACVSCQRRKKRCDGNKPCSRCVTFNEQCEYQPEKKRGPKKKPPSENGDATATAGAASATSSTAAFASGGGESSSTKSKSSSRKRVRKAKDNGEELDNDADRSASGSIVIEARLTNLGRRGTPPPDASPTSPSAKSATPPVAPVGPAPRPYKFPGQDILNSEVRVTDAPAASSAAAAQIVDLAHMPSSHLEVHVNTFFAHFYPLIPVFTEAEFRADLAAGRVPPYMLYSLCAVTSLFLMVPIGNNGRPGVTNAIAAAQLTVKRADPPAGSPPAPDLSMNASPSGPVLADLMNAPKPDKLAERAHAMIMPLFTSAQVLGVHECMSLALLAMFYYFRNQMGAGYMMGAQAAQALTSLMNRHDFNNHRISQPTPYSEEIISRLFWTGYTIDRLAAVLNTSGPVCASPQLSLEAIDELPRMPQYFDQDHNTPIKASVAHTGYIGSITLLCRIEVWIRDEWRRQQRLARTRPEDPLGIATPLPVNGVSSMGDTLTSLHRAARTWRAKAIGSHAIDVADPEWAADVVARISREAACWWLFGNWVFHNASMYVETCPRERWHMVRVVTAVAPVHSAPPVSWILRVVAEFALSLVTDGHVAPAPVCTCPAMTREPTDVNGGNCMVQYPALDAVITWFESALVRLQRDFWIVADDLLRIENIVKQLRSVAKERGQAPPPLPTMQNPLQVGLPGSTSVDLQTQQPTPPATGTFAQHVPPTTNPYQTSPPPAAQHVQSSHPSSQHAPLPAQQHHPQQQQQQLPKPPTHPGGGDSFFLGGISLPSAFGGYDPNTSASHVLTRAAMMGVPDNQQHPAPHSQHGHPPNPAQFMTSGMDPSWMPSSQSQQPSAQYHHSQQHQQQVSQSHRPPAGLGQTPPMDPGAMLDAIIGATTPSASSADFNPLAQFGSPGALPNSPPFQHQPSPQSVPPPLPTPMASATSTPQFSSHPGYPQHQPQHPQHQQQHQQQPMYAQQHMHHPHHPAQHQMHPQHHQHQQQQQQHQQQQHQEAVASVVAKLSQSSFLGEGGSNPRAGGGAAPPTSYPPAPNMYSAAPPAHPHQHLQPQPQQHQQLAAPQQQPNAYPAWFLEQHHQQQQGRK